MTQKSQHTNASGAGATDSCSRESPEQDEAAFPNFRQEVERVWNHNSSYWDDYMGEGNDFVDVLCWPAMEELLNVEQGQAVLDIACGNGLTSRRLGRKGANVVAFDIAEQMVHFARQRTTPDDGNIRYLALDASDEDGLMALGQGKFDSAISNMALFDMADIEPLFRSLFVLLKPGGRFVFSMAHPCFNQAHVTHFGEAEDRDGEWVTTYGVRVSGYMTPTVRRGLALRGQPIPQPYFHRPLHTLLNYGLQAGFVLSGVEERAFPSSHPPGSHEIGWGPNLSEIPPVIVFRMQRP